MINERGTVFEPLEEKLAKVFKAIESKQGKKIIKNSEKLVRLEDDKMTFSLDLKKMFMSLKRMEVKKELGSLIEEEEEIKSWKKDEILENLRYIWDNLYCTN